MVHVPHARMAAVACVLIMFCVRMMVRAHGLVIVMVHSFGVTVFFHLGSFAS
jgi:hypothetical protein